MKIPQIFALKLITALRDDRRKIETCKFGKLSLQKIVLKILLFPAIFFANFADNFVANIANLFLHIVVPDILVENFANVKN